MNPKMETTSPKELPPALNNSSLFTDYYLSELVKDDSFFQNSKKQAKEAWQAIKAQYGRVKGLLPTANEAETESRFIRPVLDIIGYEDLYSLQPPVPSPEGIRRPDFAFFTSEEDLEEAEKHFKGKQEYFAKALAVGDAKQWERSLDKKIKGSKDPFTNQNPNYQIDFYLRMTDKTWGIVTNGRYWRLYHRDTSYRMNVFYEVDLLAMLEEHDDSFLYFYTFFCKEALTSNFLDRAYHDSKDYVAKLGDELKENVYEALQLLAEGFLKFPENGLSEDALEEIRANTFVLIYRLLFLFYAEDRDLLPLGNPNYRSYSLRELARESAERLAHGHAFSPAARGYWAKLQDLFRIVNEGDDLLSVPPYNGGLFDESKHPFLAQYKVGELYLAKAIDRLARAQAAGRTGRGPVNYRDLDIRHIGAIYEGLLEHHLQVADQEIAVVKEKGREKFIPVAKLNVRKTLRTYQTGEVYLETDKGERKATGSYYTPHYIVQYIVQNTLGPLVEEKREEIEKERQEMEEKVKQSRGYNREVYKKQFHEIGNHLIDEILSIKVLDPAMGSGHFLVEATDFLARELIRALGESPDEVEENESRWARREVVERCIFGVDLNPLAVELAKLSLWLYTVAKDRPLSFLNHHLRLGNSLIGAWMKDLGTLPALKKRKKAEGSGQISFFESELKRKLPVVIGQVVKLLQTPSDKVEQIREKERIYDKIREVLRPFKEAANVWTSVYFGNEVEAKGYEEKLLFKLSDQSGVWESEVRSQPWFARAQATTEEKQFFHWELEFPELFYRETGQRKVNPGFDAVIGNPPYGLIADVGEKSLVQQTFTSVQYQPDSYVAFMERAGKLACQQGYQSLIVPTTFLTMHYFSAIRRFLLDHCRIVNLIHFKVPVFEDPTVESAIYVCRNELTHEKRHENTVNGVVINGLEDFVGKCFNPQLVPQVQFEDTPENDFNISLGSQETAIIGKLSREETEPLRAISNIVCGLTPYRLGKGNPPQTKAIVERRAFDADYRKDNTYCQYLMGRDFNRFVIAPLEERWVSYGDWLAEPRRAAPFFEPKKIIVRQTGDSIIAALDDQRFLNLKNVHNLRLKQEPPSHEYLLAIFNSRLITYFHRQVVPEANRVFAEVKIVDLERLPIRRITFTTPKEERERLVEEGKRLYSETLARFGSEG